MPSQSAEAVQHSFFSETPTEVGSKSRRIIAPPQENAVSPKQEIVTQTTTFPAGWYVDFDVSGFPRVALHAFNAVSRGQPDDFGKFVFDLTSPVLVYKLITWGDDEGEPQSKKLRKDQKDLLRQTTKTLQQALSISSLDRYSVEKATELLENCKALNGQIDVNGKTVLFQQRVYLPGFPFRTKKPR